MIAPRKDAARPTKKTDTRSKNLDGESVEVDALPPVELRQLVSDCIEPHIDADLSKQTKRIEELERESLREFAQNWGAA